MNGPDGSLVRSSLTYTQKCNKNKKMKGSRRSPNQIMDQTNETLTNIWFTYKTITTTTTMTVSWKAQVNKDGQFCKRKKIWKRQPEQTFSTVYLDCTKYLEQNKNPSEQQNDTSVHISKAHLECKKPFEL